MHRLLAAALAAAIVAAPAAALAADKAEAAETGLNLVRQTPGPTYFNKPGADIAAHDAALKDCIPKAGTIITMAEAVNGRGLSAVWAKGGPEAAALENCMVVGGWRVVRLPEAEGDALEKLPAKDLSARLAEWVGQAEPHGAVVRVWNNDAARGSTKRYEVRPFSSGKGSLSMASLGDVRIPEIRPEPMKVKLDKSWPTKALKPATIASAPAKAAVIIVGVKGISMRNGVAISFQRIGADGDPMPAEKDRAPGLMTAVGRWGKTEGFFTAAALPPGKWRIASLGIMPTLGFCLGAPAFEVKAGEVVYAGMFDLTSETLGPDLALEPVKAYLAGQPAADQVRSATYVNGSTANCIGAGLYALEIPGAPFEAGYVGGSAPVATAVAAPATVVETVAPVETPAS